jgi:GGDEF domain-containing protein
MGYKILRLLRYLAIFFLPGGLVVLVIYLATLYSGHMPWLGKIEKIAPYIILGIGFLLGWRFHRSRLALVVFILFLSERSLYYFGSGGSFAFGQDHNILLANCVLLPINMALFYLVKEKGLFNVRGIVRIFFILMQLLVVYLILRLKPELFDYLAYRIVQYPPLDRLPLSQIVLLVYGFITFIFLSATLFGKGGPVVRGFFWALVATLLALLAKSHGGSTTLYYSAAGLIIIMAVIETAYAMAFQDELTGLPARRALTTALHGLGKRYAIAMLDIDFFKKFNDKYGHDVGDQVLCMVASHLKRVGGGGRPFRYGGEEFTILFSGKSKEEAIPHLGRLRESIEAAQFALRGKNRPKKTPRKLKRNNTDTKTVSVTISIGVAEPDKAKERPAGVMKKADQALYRAKKRGRNCVAT